MIKHFGILCIYKNKGADQLRGTAQLISTVVFAAKSSTVPLCPPKIQASPMPYLVAEQAGRRSYRTGYCLTEKTEHIFY